MPLNAVALNQQRQKQERARPPKSKRNRARDLAEMLFMAETSTPEKLAEIEQQFLAETSGDPLFYAYTWKVLRRKQEDAAKEKSQESSMICHTMPTQDQAQTPIPVQMPVACHGAPVTRGYDPCAGRYSPVQQMDVPFVARSPPEPPRHQAVVPDHIKQPPAAPPGYEATVPDQCFRASPQPAPPPCQAQPGTLMYQAFVLMPVSSPQAVMPMRSSTRTSL
eukprot:gnl/TRDRNA2_/TRDRNA2_171587_c0_seq2.p1 gnl/TRDRNA2_/TRDRNA2_171587_c0~~gnl/TRDRNA2_/TRDRNA2_171587_c0_seq2.p1  ORF type:complete len:221 (+),score=30.78 gnl/TRDRNA2_/TRDRNA2_171587_c0_seq2:1-663(+)